MFASRDVVMMARALMGAVNNVVLWKGKFRQYGE
jgi:hypothetical protein